MDRGWLILFALSASPLFADGGAVQLQQQAGPFLITVFASPVPAQVGPVDLSVLVQDRNSLNPVLDAVVSLQIGEEIVPATHALAQNKLLYAGTVNLNEPRDWKYSVSARRNSIETKVAGTLRVDPSAAKLDAYWRYLALPPFAIALFTAHQLLKRHKGRLLSGPGAGLGRCQPK